MAGSKLKRYGMEEGAKILIVLGLLFNLSAWLVAAYYLSPSGGRIALLIVPFIFTCVSALLLLVIHYRYTLFEKYPYLMSLPSIFYRIGEQKDGANKQSMAFSMIFTVHALVIALVGFMGLILTITIGTSIHRDAVSSGLYLYLLTVAVLVASVFLQYRRIYIRFSRS